MPFRFCMGDMMPTITDLATANDDFTILAGLVLLNDSNNPGSTLLETLSDPLANVGLYAPTDNAFLDLAVSFGYVGDLSDDTAIANFIYNELSTIGDPDALLEAILTGHLEATPPALSIGDPVTDSDMQTPDATVIAITPADNGTIFVLDAVLLPTEVSLNDTPAGPTVGDDLLVGTSFADHIDLLDGRDSFMGREGDDSISGNLGNDRIDGGEGNDTIFLGSGNDHGWGGAGDDSVYGGTGADQVNGNSGDDVLSGGKGGDTLRGGKGEDVILGGSQSDEIYGGAQSDEVYGGTGHDLIYGEEGKDTLNGGSGNDLIYGGIMDDFIFGDHGDDTAYGGDGQDHLYGGKSDDRLYGDDGKDTLEGGAGDDVLFGGSDNDALYGGAQGDRLGGGGGDDLINGGLGGDRMTGNTGADIFEFRGTFNHDIISDFGNGDDKILLGAELGIWDIERILLYQTTEVDGNTVIDLKGWGSITLEGVLPSELTADDFIVELPIEPLA